MTSITSTNMLLTIPTVGLEPEPTYAFDINTCLTIIDSHNHSAGSGVQITPDGMDISTDLDIQSNDLLNVSELVFSASGSASSTLMSLYVAPGSEGPAINDLWYTDGNGNEIQLTSAGLVNATIGNLAGQSYASGTFIWKQGTGSTTPADFDIGSIILRPNVALTTFGVELSPPSAIASQYTINLPALPASTLPVQLSNAGVMTTGQITNAQIATDAVTTVKILNANVTNAKLATDAVSTAKIADGAVTSVKITSNYDTATLNNTGITTSPTTVTGAQINATGTKPVYITLFAGSVGFFAGSGIGTGSIVTFTLYRHTGSDTALATFSKSVTDGTESGQYISRSFISGPYDNAILVQSAAPLVFVDLPAAGLNRYDIVVTITGSLGSGGAAQVNNASMIVQEL